MQIENNSVPHNVIHRQKGWDFNHWCEELNLRAEELKEIIKRVGPDLRDIRDYLDKRKMKDESPS